MDVPKSQGSAAAPQQSSSDEFRSILDYIHEQVLLRVRIYGRNLQAVCLAIGEADCDRKYWSYEQDLQPSFDALALPIKLAPEAQDLAFTFLEKVRAKASLAPVVFSGCSAESAHSLAMIIIARAVRLWQTLVDVRKRGSPYRLTALGVPVCSDFYRRWVKTHEEPQNLDAMLRLEYRAAVLELENTKPQQTAVTHVDNLTVNAAHVKLGATGELLLTAIDQADIGSNVFKYEGPVWHIRYQGKQIYLPHFTGLRYIARLLKQPNERVSVDQLVAPDAIGGTIAKQDNGPATDIQGLANYRRKLAELETEIAEAKASGDAGGQMRAQEAKESIVEHLKSVTDHAGRPRKDRPQQTSMRTAVSKAIDRALHEIKEHHADLWEHLESSIVKGNFLRYCPATPTTWET